MQNSYHLVFNNYLMVLTDFDQIHKEPINKLNFLT